MRTRLRSLSLPGPAGALEAVLHERDGETPSFVALVCHPHPLYGGTLHNKVVHRVASTLHEAGGAALRFNFRGVGKSGGRSEGGAVEVEDAAAAFRWLAEHRPGAPLWAAGFSFGSWIAASLAAREPRVERLILVAPPVDRSDFSMMKESPVPKLVLQGSADEVCPPASLAREFPTWREPKRLVMVPDAGHFFDRRLGELGEALRKELSRPTR